ncbi:MAG: DUF1565 domain-containing protein [Phycisphaerae bacterium]
MPHEQASAAIYANGVQFTGFTVTGAGWAEAGIHLCAADDCTISGNMATDNYYGIVLSWATEYGPGSCDNTGAVLVCPNPSPRAGRRCR